jgi:hypothetical protein
VKNTTKRSTEIVLDASMEVGLEINAIKINYMYVCLIIRMQYSVNPPFLPPSSSLPTSVQGYDVLTPSSALKFII